MSFTFRVSFMRIAFFLLIFFNLSLLIGCIGFPSLYEGKAIKKLPSPEGDMIAVWYEGGGGATGANSSSVNIFESSSEIATVTAEAVRKGRVFFIGENPEINLAWKSFNELEIEYLAPKEWEVIEHKKHYLGVTISLKHIEGMPTPTGQRK